MPKYMKGERRCWSIASHSRSSAAMRSSNQCRIERSSLRSGVAVRPSSSTGSTWSRSLRYEGAAAWWNSSTITTSKWSGARSSRLAALRLWIEAKTWSKRCGRAPPIHFSPNDASRSAWRKVARLWSRISLRCATNSRRERGSSLTEAPVVDGGHDRLAGAGGGDEQVAVVTTGARQRDLFEQPLLERFEAKLDGTEDDDGPGVGAAGSFGLVVELFRVVGNEVAALPVALEDGLELGEDVGVAGRRGTDVPLEAGDLGGVREVRRADVGGREAGAAVEHPGLGVEAGGAEVVGDPHVGAEAGELVERSPLGGAGVGGGEHAQRSASVRSDGEATRAAG